MKHFIWENKLIELIFYIRLIEIAIGLVGELRETRDYLISQESSRKL